MSEWGFSWGGWLVWLGGTVHDELRSNGWALYNNNIIRSGPHFCSWGHECMCGDRGLREAESGV
jgi:hypothetical protein